MVSPSINTGVLIEKFGLGDRPGVLNGIKLLIREAISENSSLDRVFSKQDPEKLAEIRNRVSRGFPDIFEDPSLDRGQLQDRMKFAMWYGEKVFSMMRHIARVKKERRASITPSRVLGTRPRSNSPYVPKQLPLSISTATQPRRSSARLSAIPRRNTFSGSAVGVLSDTVRNPTPSLPPYSVSPSTLEAPSGAQPTRDLSLSDPPAIITEAAASISGTNPELPSPSSAMTQSTTTSSSFANSSYEYRIGEVAAFLRTCEPGMQFLLNSFVSYGCRNRQSLAIVARWSDDKIEDFLRRVIAHTPPVQNTCEEMDLLFLKYHFGAYFNQQSPKSEE